MCITNPRTRVDIYSIKQKKPDKHSLPGYHLYGIFYSGISDCAAHRCIAPFSLPEIKPSAFH